MEKPASVCSCGPRDLAREARARYHLIGQIRFESGLFGFTTACLIFTVMWTIEVTARLFSHSETMFFCMNLGAAVTLSTIASTAYWRRKMLQRELEYNDHDAYPDPMYV